MPRSAREPGVEWLTAAEVRAYLKISPATLDRWTWSGRLRAYRPEGEAGSRRVRRYKRADVDALMRPEPPGRREDPVQTDGGGR